MSGQAGVQMGTSINKDGSFEEMQKHENANMSIFFMKTSSGRSVPNSVFVDLEPSVIDEIPYMVKPEKDYEEISGDTPNDDESAGEDDEF
ncbi:Tubulin alpha-2 chain [Pseudolycoriella hygida]|uniref:Tubulin alpha-2 chain n=1 Tax=Pseudolycoriella hygida TaxID=35572 RepID=A0A9Q0MPI3_9DIPT|nr:Tubulin alpha-2 chain [Pseudolycoriella hygida]